MSPEVEANDDHDALRAVRGGRNARHAHVCGLEHDERHDVVRGVHAKSPKFLDTTCEQYNSPSFTKKRII
ncbi:hypothetical protein Y032_0083g1617 [Ancylostoma ceylanicum]|uniref:Uncharacterized protein n=1 Tax=Ancylostoma ceylanicum TaxID=53326 RepID=A0A016TQ66_9BILA|nr:hypothetical protein Y032_0083g1617 [Ancylostoma ceylanicum]